MAGVRQSAVGVHIAPSAGSVAPICLPPASSTAIHVTTVIDTQDGHYSFDLIDSIQDPVGPTAGTVDPGQFVAQRTTDPLRVVDQGASDELDAQLHSPSIDTKYQRPSMSAMPSGNDVTLPDVRPGTSSITHRLGSNPAPKTRP